MKQQQIKPGFRTCLGSSVLGGISGIIFLLAAAAILAALELTGGIGQVRVNLLLKIGLAIGALIGAGLACKKAGGSRAIVGAGCFLVMGLILFAAGKALAMDSLPKPKSAWMPMLLGVALGIMASGTGKGGHSPRKKR